MSIQEHIDLFRQLASPVDYFNGISFPAERFPEEALLFFRHTSNESMNFHVLQHHRFVLCICLATEGGVQVDADVFNLKPGEGLLFFPYQPHHFTQFDSDEIAWLFVTFEMRDSEWLEPLRSKVLSIGEGELDQFKQMAEKYNSQQSDLVIPLLAVLLDRLLNTVGKPHLAKNLSSRATQSHQHANLSAALDYIHSKLDTPIQVGDVVAAAGCSETVLREIFVKQLNTSIATYIRKRRILRACQLLDKSDESIAGISDRCGFSSQYAFSRTFKQMMNCSPSSYRRK